MTVLFEDNDIIAVDKPAGLLSVPGRGADKLDSVESRARERIAGASAIHRLDMATSGIMLIAKHKAAERHFKIQFEQRKVTKIYYAITCGIMKVTEGEMRWPLIVDWEHRPRQKVCEKEGKAALTHYQVIGIDQTGKQTLVRLRPLTGRSHQLRVHLATLGYPIVGDDLYHPRPKKTRLMLHASDLTISKRDGEDLILHSALPDSFVVERFSLA
ncbi:MAG: bifunctional tRNA pseudouridine(32) synthase/ribosomal large subunit pseudouridine synthase RluA [Cardiobacteriales bacterium]|nr:MAG: bifunctional tRNA pseudouridine(32) synthase/ribosomal large subunit pseudouridine synthase RluA [Cardiobacteriales bacterium]